MGGLFSAAAKKPRGETLRGEALEIMREKMNTPIEFEKSLREVAKKAESASLLHFVVEYGSGSIDVARAIDEVLTIEAKRKSDSKEFVCLFKQQDRTLADGTEARQTPLELAIHIMKDRTATDNNLFIGEAAVRLAQRLNRIPADDAHHSSAVGQIRSAASSLGGVSGYAADQIRQLAVKPKTSPAVVGAGALATASAERGVGAFV